jgi:AraC-like DNA-binding protein
MPSDRPSVSSQVRISPVLGAVIVLICLGGIAFAAAGGTDGQAKKTTTKAAKPVFSVSGPDSSVTLKVAHPSIHSAQATAPSVRKADTSHHAVAEGVAAAVVKDSAPVHPVPLPESQRSVVLPEPKKAVDTILKETPVSVAKAPVKAAVSLKKHIPLKQSLLFRIVVFLGSIVLIAAAVRFMKKQKAAPRFLTTTRLSVMDKEVQRACRYIEKNFADPDLSLENVCRDLVTGEAFLEALMERDLGVTVRDFILHVRINRAKQVLVKDPSAGSEAIARETGFPDSTAFLAAFKKLTGTPFEAFTQKNRKSV